MVKESGLMKSISNKNLFIFLRSPIFGLNIVLESVFKVSALALLVNYAVDDSFETSNVFDHVTKLGVPIVSYSIGETLHYFRKFL